MNRKKPIKVENLCQALFNLAKRKPHFVFYSLTDKIQRYDVLEYSYRRCFGLKKSAGPDGITFGHIEQNIGRGPFLEQFEAELKSKTFRPGPIRRKFIDNREQ